MHLLILILGSVLLPKAYTLTCHECAPGASGTCTDTKDCTALGQCGSVRVISYMGNTELANINVKSCATADQCISGSINFGILRTVINSKCCTTDLCNSQSSAVPSIPSPNGKKCYGCDVKECNITLNCLGNEERCISTTVETAGQKKTMKGCVSTTICSSLSSAQAAGVVGTDMSCCKGDMCNSASSTGVSLLLLVAPMVSFALFF